MTKIVCSQCNKIHDKNKICSIKRKRKLNRYKDQSVYATKDWIKVRQDILDYYKNICIYSFYKYNKIKVAETVHHIIELTSNIDLAYEPSNLIALSYEAHAEIHKLYEDNREGTQKLLREFQERYRVNGLKII